MPFKSNGKAHLQAAEAIEVIGLTDNEDHDQIRQWHHVAVQMAHLVDRTVGYFQRVVELVMDLDG